MFKYYMIETNICYYSERLRGKYINYRIVEGSFDICHYCGREVEHNATD